MNWKSKSVIIFVGIFAIVAIVCAIIFIAAYRMHNSGNGELEELSKNVSTNQMEAMIESSTFIGIKNVGVIDAPSVPVSCARGYRYDSVSNSCRKNIK